LEREYRGHEAGIRTSSLVCAGAALFGEISLMLGDSRVDQGVVQGIGFLGAGLIFQRGDDVRGVTTAATIWILAGIGLLVARELWLASVLLTLVVVVLLELSPVSDWVYSTGLRRQAHRRRNRDNHESPEG
jgi:putative Mg2+ transporter-C (MgtC) family protein